MDWRSSSPQKAQYWVSDYVKSKFPITIELLKLKLNMIWFSNNVNRTFNHPYNHHQDIQDSTFCVGNNIRSKVPHSSLNMVNLTSFSQMSPENGDKWDWPGDKWDWLGTFEIDQSMPIVPWGHLRFTSKSHLSLSEPEPKYIDVQPPLGLTEKWDWPVNLTCPPIGV